MSNRTLMQIMTSQLETAFPHNANLKLTSPLDLIDDDFDQERFDAPQYKIDTLETEESF